VETFKIPLFGWRKCKVRTFKLERKGAGLVVNNHGRKKKKGGGRGPQKGRQKKKANVSKLDGRSRHKKKVTTLLLETLGSWP